MKIRFTANPHAEHTDQGAPACLVPQPNAGANNLHFGGRMTQVELPKDEQVGIHTHRHIPEFDASPDGGLVVMEANQGASPSAMQHFNYCVRRLRDGELLPADQATADFINGTQPKDRKVKVDTVKHGTACSHKPCGEFHEAKAKRAAEAKAAASTKDDTKKAAAPAAEVTK